MCLYFELNLTVISSPLLKQFTLIVNKFIYATVFSVLTKILKILDFDKGEKKLGNVLFIVTILLNYCILTMRNEKKVTISSIVRV